MSVYYTKKPYLTYKGITYKINAGGKKQINTKQVKSVISKLMEFTSQYSKVLVVIFVLHQKFQSSRNPAITRLGNKLSGALKRRYKMNKSTFIWARETHKEIYPHYHCTLILNGHRIQHPSKLFDIMKELWIASGGTRLSIPNNCFYYINGSEDEREIITREAIYRLSYLTKKRGKENKPPTTKSFGIHNFS